MLKRFIPEQLRADLVSGTMSARVAASFALAAVLMVLISAAFSSLYFGALLRDADTREAQAVTRAAGERVANVAGFMERFAQRLALAEEVRTALVDSAGVDRHLTPVLRLARLTLEEYGQGAGGVSIAITDYRGRLIGGEMPGGAKDIGAPQWIELVMQGKPHAVFNEETGVVTVAFPVTFAATGVPEGMLIGWLDLKSLVRETAGEGHARFTITGSPAKSGTVVTPLALKGVLGVLNLQIEARPDPDAVRGQLWSALAMHLLLLVPVVAASIVLAWLLGRRLGAPIRELADWAANLKSHRLSPPPATRASSSEVLQLGTALQAAVAEIEANEAALNRFRMALDSTQNGAVICDAQAQDWPVIYANQSFTRITGYRNEEIIGRSLRVLHRHCGDQPALDELRAALKAGRPCHVTLRNERKDGSEFWNDLSVAPIFGDDGRPTHFIGVQVDVTERRQSESQLRETQKFEAIGQLTGGLAHDFNNLLGVVIGNLDLLGERLPNDPRVRHIHASAVEAAMRGAGVTRSLLAVARRQRLELKTTDLNGLLSEIQPLLEATLGATVTVRTAFAPAQLPIKVDAASFSNVLLNLIINARDAMRDTPDKALQIGTREQAFAEDAVPGLPEGDYAVLEITDNGCGMPDAVLQRAFEPFFTTKNTGEGTGLGLSITRGVIEQMQGRVQLMSTHGEGTTVQVILPLSRDAHAPSDKALTPAATATGTLQQTQRVLVVDDEQGLRALACEWLRRMGFEVASAKSGDEALPMVKTGAYDLLVTDVVMPGTLDGIALARLARQHQPELRIVIVSGYAKSLLDQESLPGVFLRKPYRRDDLAKAVAAATAISGSPTG